MEKPTPTPAPAPVAVVIVPLPAQGHLNQLLHLSRLISNQNLPIHFVSSATHNRQAKLRVEGWDPLTISTIHFHDLPVPHFPTPPPNPHAPTKFPDHFLPSFEAAIHLRKPFSSLLTSLASTARRIIVIHEYLMSFAAKEASKHPNIETYEFTCTSAFCSFFFQHDLEAIGKNPTDPDAELLGFPPISFDGCYTKRFFDFIESQQQMITIPSSGHLINTCRPIEAQFIDLLCQGQFAEQKTWAIGPLHPIKSYNNKTRHGCLEWLDKQPPNSVIYVSFGTMSSISNEQIHEIAIGLERSKQRFIWVVREADRSDIFAEEGAEEEIIQIQVPEWYEDRVKGVGVVVREWAPQREILGHVAVGGFMSHCGWNSCMESMSMGVPMATWPMHSDQPRNAVLVTKVLKIGVIVQEWGRREEMVKAEEVEDAVRRLMGSEEGEEMRKRAGELGIAVRGAWDEGGSSRADFDSFIAHISRE